MNKTNMKKSVSKSVLPLGAKKFPRLPNEERRETQRQVISLIGWLIRLIVHAVKNRKNKEVSK